MDDAEEIAALQTERDALAMALEEEQELRSEVAAERDALRAVVERIRRADDAIAEHGPGGAMERLREREDAIDELLDRSGDMGGSLAEDET